MFVVGYYSYASVREEKKVSMRTGIALANCIFIVFAAIALVQYINNTGSNYLITVIIDLLIYIMVQVGLIYRRIGLSVKEEKEFAQAKIFAFTDELTGLGNRRHFYNLIEDYEKNKLPRDLTYIAVDVNRLKYYNDTMGHNAGDELLKGTADCLRRAFSSSSTVNIARLGGDEFGVILISNEADINRRVNNLRTYLLRWRGKYINGISIALGFASVREDPNATIDDLAKLADEKMYMDKKQYYESSGIERRTSR
jgi:diguanylate cyclase (GGDEF)-like protein